MVVWNAIFSIIYPDMDKSNEEFNKGSLILVTGVTGYVGGLLVKELKKEGHKKRFLVRNPGAIDSKEFPGVEIVKCDVLKAESLQPVMQGVHTAFYLMQSMGETRDFEETDRIMARKFGEHAKKAGVKRIIYLGGLGEGKNISPHLRSRQEVGEILRQSGVPVIEFRASIIIGAGSASFEIIRAVAERLLVIFAPKWSKNECQPIYIGNVISYLIASLDLPIRESRIYEIGSPDVTCYVCLMQYYSKLRKLPHLFVQLPLLTPRLAGYGLIFTNPSLIKVGRPLLEGLRTRTVVNDNSAVKEFGIIPLSSERAIETALNKEDDEFATSSWCKKLAGIERKPYGGLKYGHRYVDSYFMHVDRPPEQVFKPIKCIGGDTGWYVGHTLMRIRGFFDALAGGPGWPRCRPDSDDLQCGDSIDNWRVTEYIPNHRLGLEAWMKLPGRAWLDFEVCPEGDGSQLRITAIFDPKGVLGLLYWFAIYPFHGYIFRNMVKEIAKRATK